MLRRFGVMYVIVAAVGMLAVLPFVARPSVSHAETLRICVIQNPGDTCDTSVGTTTPSAGGTEGGHSTGSGSSSGIRSINTTTATTTPLAFDPVSGEVFFSGSAHPSSVVTLMLEGQFLATTTAGSDAAFHFNIKKVTPGTYTYEVWAEDGSGMRSVARSFTVSVAKGVGTVVSGIDLISADVQKQPFIAAQEVSHDISRAAPASGEGSVLLPHEDHPSSPASAGRSDFLGASMSREGSDVGSGAGILSSSDPVPVALWNGLINNVTKHPVAGASVLMLLAYAVHRQIINAGLWILQYIYIYIYIYIGF